MILFLFYFLHQDTCAFNLYTYSKCLYQSNNVILIFDIIRVKQKIGIPGSGILNLHIIKSNVVQLCNSLTFIFWYDSSIVDRVQAAFPKIYLLFDFYMISDIVILHYLDLSLTIELLSIKTYVNNISIQTQLN